MRAVKDVGMVVEGLVTRGLLGSVPLPPMKRLILASPFRQGTPDLPSGYRDGLSRIGVVL